ncbi:MAG: hypothetical protein J0L72_10575 [Armatimonadetes bacterium]|nr:hypothetical protein [Armatimonadota bacterium]
MEQGEYALNVVYKGSPETGFDFSLTGCLRREYWAAYYGGASIMAGAEVK